MKKNVFVFVSAMLIITTINAQKTMGVVAENNNPYNAASDPFNTIYPGTAAINVSLVSSKIQKEFSKYCKGAQNIYWEMMNEGIIANYRAGGQKGRRFYNRKGNFICNILSCEENQLPADITGIIKRTYSQQCKIIAAEDIKTAVRQFYFIYIKNKTCVMKLSVCDGEIEELQVYSN